MLKKYTPLDLSCLNEHPFKDPLLSTPFSLKNCSPDRISGIAKTIASRNQLFVDSLNSQLDLGLISEENMRNEQEKFLEGLWVCEEEGVYRNIDFMMPIEGAIKRSCDFRAIKRQLVKIANDERINEEANNAKVGGSTNQPYCSDQTLTFRKRQFDLTMDALSKIYVSGKNSDQLITLAELAQNQELQRFNRLYHLVKNIESMAEDSGFNGYFITFTAPANYHPNPAMGKRSYDQTNLRNAHLHIQKCWKKLRARLAKAGIPLSIETCFGVRTVEMHRDGCAHWHLMIFTTASNFSIFSQLADEIFPYSNQWDCKSIDKSKGDASSYIFKYIAKAVDSSQFQHKALHPEEQDSERFELDMSDLTHAARVSAALKAQRIRQFQCFGLGNALTKYRLINKIQEHIDTFESVEVKSALSSCRMYNDGTRNKEGKNLLGFKNLVNKFVSHIQLVKEQHTNRFGEPVQRIMGVQFSCGYVYHLPQYDIHAGLPELIEAELGRPSFPSSSTNGGEQNNEDLDKLERDTYMADLRAANDEDIVCDIFKEHEYTSVTLIYSDPREANRSGRAKSKRPTSSELIELIKDRNLKRHFVSHVYIEKIPTDRRILETEEIMALLSNW